MRQKVSRKLSRLVNEARQPRDSSRDRIEHERDNGETRCETTQGRDNRGDHRSPVCRAVAPSAVSGGFTHWMKREALTVRPEPGPRETYRVPQCHSAQVGRPAPPECCERTQLHLTDQGRAAQPWNCRSVSTAERVGCARWYVPWSICAQSRHQAQEDTNTERERASFSEYRAASDSTRTGRATPCLRLCCPTSRTTPLSLVQPSVRPSSSASGTRGHRRTGCGCPK